MSRATRAPRSVSVIAIALLLAGSVPAWAQEPGSSVPPLAMGGMCILEPAEVAELLGSPGEYAVDPRFEGCTYDGPGGYLALDWASYYSIDHAPDAVGQELTIGGHPAWFDGTTSTLYVDTGYRTYSVYLTVDSSPGTLEQMAPIAEVAIPRYAARDQASPAFVLGDQFPTTLGGEPVSVDLRMSGPEWLENLSSDQRAQVEQLFTDLGVSASDVGVATGGTMDGAQLTAIRMLGASAADFAVPLMTVATGAGSDLTVTPATIGGKDVLVLSMAGEESTLTVYPGGDTAWLLMMDDALVEEALGALP